MLHIIVDGARILPLRHLHPRPAMRCRFLVPVHARFCCCARSTAPDLLGWRNTGKSSYPPSATVKLCLAIGMTHRHTMSRARANTGAPSLTRPHPPPPPFFVALRFRFADAVGILRNGCHGQHAKHGPIGHRGDPVPAGIRADCGESPKGPRPYVCAQFTRSQQRSTPSQQCSLGEDRV